MLEKEYPNYPSFKDFRTTSDGVMVADVGFKKQLWALDPELDVVWDWGSRRWEIWRFPGQGGKLRKFVDHKAFHVMTVQTKERTFRELGADILLKLQWGDPHKWELKDLVRYFDQMDDNIQRAKERKFKSWFESITAETFDYVRGVVKKPVPSSYNLKPGEEKLLLKVKPRGITNRYVLKLPQMTKIQNAIVGGGL